MTRTNNFYFDHDKDDLRGWPIRDSTGTQVGTVAGMLVDPSTSYVTAIRLEDGRDLPARELRIGAHRELRWLPPPKVAAAPTEPEKPVKAVKAVATDIGSASAMKGQPARAAPPPPAVRRESADADVVLQLIDEELDVEKRTYVAGGIHVESHIVSEQIAREVPIREEHVSVSRTKIDRALGDADANRLFHDEAFEVKTTSEIPVVEKTAHLVEEVVIKKSATSHDETVRDKVRRMDAEITELRASEALPGGRR